MPARGARRGGHHAPSSSPRREQAAQPPEPDRRQGCQVTARPLPRRVHPQAVVAAARGWLPTVQSQTASPWDRTAGHQATRRWRNQSGQRASAVAVGSALPRSAPPRVTGRSADRADGARAHGARQADLARHATTAYGAELGAPSAATQSTDQARRHHAPSPLHHAAAHHVTGSARDDAGCRGRGRGRSSWSWPLADQAAQHAAKAAACGASPPARRGSWSGTGSCASTLRRQRVRLPKRQLSLSASPHEPAREPYTRACQGGSHRPSHRGGPSGQYQSRST